MYGYGSVRYFANDIDQCPSAHLCLLCRLAVPVPLGYSDALRLCASLGQGRLPEPVSLPAWRSLLNSTALQLGGSDRLDLWVPYTSPPANTKVI